MQRALPGARQHLGAILASASVVVKALCAVVLFLYLLSFAVDTGCLAVTPGYLFPPNFWIWTLATHGLMEQHVWDVAISLATVVVAGRLLEPLWGALELLIFFSVVNVSVGLLGALAYLLTYMASFNLVYLFTIRIHALKALNERLKRVEDQSAWPSMDDDEEEAGAKTDSPLPLEEASTPPGKSTDCSEEREEGLLGVPVAFRCVWTTLTQDPCCYLVLTPDNHNARLHSHQGFLCPSAVAVTTVPSRGCHSSQQQAMVRAIDANGLRPVVDKHFELEQIVEAFRYQESNRHFGKICLTW
eukprot:XP_008772004.1 PREDICTED: transmembrane protein 115-like [Rattus norvegicus]